MRLSRLLVPTLRDAPAEAETPGQRVLIRGGYLRTRAAGVVQLLPLGRRLVRRLAGELVAALEAQGAEECALAPDPADVPGDALLRLASTTVRSYRQLPRRLWQTRRDLRERERAGPGLFELRDTEVLEAFALGIDPASLEEPCEQLLAAVRRTLGVLGVEALEGRAAAWARGGVAARVLFVEEATAREALLVCRPCRRAHEATVVPRPPPTAAPEGGEDLVEVATPGCTTIPSLAGFLGIPEEHIAKAVLLTREDGGLVCAVVPGTAQASLEKIAAATGARSLRAATEAEIRAAGAVPGYASPVGLRGPCEVLLDPQIAAGARWVAGANREGFHLRNVDPRRDLAGVVADLCEAVPGTACPDCGAGLEEARGVVLGTLTRLGTALAASLAATAQDAGGGVAPLAAACLRLDLYALVGALAEVRGDGERPGCWSPAAAPFQVHLVSLAREEDACAAEAARLEARMEGMGLRVLHDDRQARAGEKFADADLVGAPVRVTLGPKGLAQRQAEVKDMAAGEVLPTRLDLVADRVMAILERARAAPELPGDG